MKRAPNADAFENDFESRRSFVEMAVRHHLEKEVERALRDRFEKLGLEMAEETARWFTAKLHDEGYIAVTASEMLASYVGNMVEDLIDEQEVYREED